MARYYMRVNDTFFYLDATTQISVSYPARVSSNPMQDRSTQSDHYVVDQPTCTISGLITDIKILRTDQDKPTRKWIDDLLRMTRANRSPVSLKHSVDGDEEDNWFITNFTPTQDNSRHRVSHQSAGGTVQQAFSIRIQLKQGLLAKGITTTVQPSQAYLDALQEKGKKNTATQQFGDKAKGKRDSQNSFEKGRMHMAAVRKNLSSIANPSEGEE